LYIYFAAGFDDTLKSLPVNLFLFFFVVLCVITYYKCKENSIKIMKSSFCRGCGSENKYEIHPPNFCGGCGESLSGETRQPTSVATTPKRRKTRFIDEDEEFEDDLEDDETNVTKVPRIKKLAVKIDAENYNQMDLGKFCEAQMAKSIAEQKGE
jgi:hypothetical protein